MQLPNLLQDLLSLKHLLLAPDLLFPAILVVQAILILINPNSPSFHDLLRSHLQIPSHLANCSDNSIHIAYEKYLAYIKAVPLLDELWTQRALPFTQKPSKTDIIESMQGKSYWYDYHRQAFPR